MALNILIGLQSLVAGVMAAILAARFLLPLKARDALLRACHDIVPERLLPHRH
jgi:hypothetical protein